MDRTGPIKPTRDRRVIERHQRAWERFALDGDCPYCGHEYATHALAVGQPHFFRPATDDEQGDPSLLLYSVPLYKDADSENERLRLRRIVVAKRVEVIVACCLNCAEEKGTPQATCFQAKVAIGEIVGKAVDRGID